MLKRSIQERLSSKFFQNRKYYVHVKAVRAAFVPAHLFFVDIDEIVQKRREKPLLSSASSVKNTAN